MKEIVVGKKHLPLPQVPRIFCGNFCDPALEILKKEVKCPFGTYGAPYRVDRFGIKIPVLEPTPEALSRQ
jgi:hypothetical protein